jgi:ribosomal protein S18 acetylase RimI-like enzyme
MPSFSLRPGRAADAASLAEFGARTFRDTFAAHNRPEDMDAYVSLAYGEQQQAAELADPQVSVLVAESSEGALIGYAVVRQAPDEAPPCVTGEAPVELARLYVDHGWHGRGVGEALMRGVVERARERGGDTLWLGVWEHNPRARAFYARWGFREVGEHPFPLGADIQRDILLARPLRPRDDGSTDHRRSG